MQHMVDFSGRTIDNYQLLRRLGGGNFGDVYLAEHIHRKTLFAVKILRSHLSKENLQTFLNEARVFRLEHPNIIRVRDFGIDGDTPFIVMDYLPGGTLRHLHPQGEPLPLKTLVSYVKQIGGALQYAHDEGLVHRDVKPENMLIGQHGEIFLSDFGIVTTSYSLSPGHQSRVAGTALYMAPEQILAHPVRASDQYALAALAYEWLVGVPPFLGTMAELTAKHLNTPPPALRQRDPSIPPEVERVVLKALAKAPAQRFPSVHEFVVALEEACKLPIGTTLQVLEMHSDLLSALAWSPDGTRLAVASSDATVGVWDVEACACRFTYTGHSREVTAVAWSPGGERLASASSDGTVQVWDAANGQTLITYSGHKEDVFAAGWSPDGSKIASAGADQTVQVWEAATGQVLAAYAGYGDDILSVAWSPDGTKLASASYDMTVQVREVLSKKQVLTYNSHAAVYMVAWSPDGTRLASASYDTTVEVRDATTGEALQAYHGHTRGVFALAWAPGSASIASGGDDSTVQIWESTTGRHVYTYQGHSRGVRAIAWSPLAGNDARIASAGLDQAVLIWQAR
jgi:WD40 repeat protein